ncbi:MAG TPA: hypothetical protein VFJ98_07405 [Mycobacteriales bacterium]|nr:hypothetical protein [Mycobacteriales bacterium]
MRKFLAASAVATAVGSMVVFLAPDALANTVNISYTCTQVTITYGNIPSGETVTAYEDVVVNGNQIAWLKPFTFTGPTGTDTIAVTLHDGDVLESYASVATSDSPDTNDRLGPLTVAGCSTQTGASPLTPGYWKNHQAKTTALLPQSLGGYTVDTFAKAQAVFGAMNCGSSTDQGAIGCLAGHLLATELNLANGSSSSISPAVAQANQVLTNVGYAGPGAALGNPGAYDRGLAVSLKTQLDTYNNGG